MISDEQLRQYREIIAKATPGPWIYDMYFAGDKSHHIKQPAAGHRVLAVCLLKQRCDMKFHPKHDFEFIVAAREGWPRALAEIERLRAEVECLMVENKGA